MTSELISKRTRNEFRETLVGWPLREIDIEFENEGFEPDSNYCPPMSGQRRGLVEQYYHNIDFTSTTHVRRLLRVYESIITTVELHSTDLAARLRSCLERDGFSFDGGRLVIRHTAARFQDLRAAAEVLRSGDLLAHLERIETAIDSDPALAVGSAKELLETTCKAILSARKVQVDKADDIPQLMRKTMKVLNLLPEDIPERARGAEIIRRLLSNLSTAVTGLAEIRNLYGTGHGRYGSVRGLSARHAKLAAGAASTLAVFLLETHEDRP